jgi:hypothetical protein
MSSRRPAEEDALKRAKIQMALDDGAPPAGLDEVFDRLETLHIERVKDGSGGATGESDKMRNKLC